MSFYIYQSAVGDEKEREKLVFVKMVYHRLRSMVCGSGYFFQYRLNVKIHVQVHFTVASQFYVHVNVELYMHAFMHLCLVQLWLLCGGK